MDPNGILGTLFAPIVTLFGGEHKVPTLFITILRGDSCSLLSFDDMAFREDVMEEPAISYGFRQVLCMIQ